METCVIHKNRVAGRHNGKQIELKPVNEETSICCVPICFRRQNLVIAFRSDDVYTCKFFTAPDIFNLYAAQSTTTLSLIILIAATFIYINALTFGDVDQFF